MTPPLHEALYFNNAMLKSRFPPHFVVEFFTYIMNDPPITDKGSRKRSRSGFTARSSSLIDVSGNSSARRLAILPPPIVQDYFPYSRGQLLDVKARQIRSCGLQWDAYYRNNTVRGYKDRHYLLREFEELQHALQTLAADPLLPSVTMVEIGCGVGNAVLPILDEYHQLGGRFRAFGFDISAVAIALLQGKIKESRESRLKVQTHDLAESPLMVGPGEWMESPADFGTIIFVLCSVPVHRHADFAHRCAALIRPEGFLLVRDYGVGDLAEQRFAAERRVDDSTFVRCNGTLSHFFHSSELRQLFECEGYFTLVEIKEIERDVENRKEGLVMHRKFVQARFRRTRHL
jgi:2-polyprenyl-3-methyl-5-hydroxy-6-metoxy-1,4-benzoquinol methylase